MRTAAGRPGPSPLTSLATWTGGLCPRTTGDGTSYETVSGDNGLTEFSGTMTGQAADHFTADLPDADESSVVEAKSTGDCPGRLKKPEKRGQELSLSAFQRSLLRPSR